MCLSVTFNEKYLPSIENNLTIPNPSDNNISFQRKLINFPEGIAQIITFEFLKFFQLSFQEKCENLNELKNLFSNSTAT